ncbi:BT4734/BF3469 family protein [Mariniflexile gromovii]|uniref:VirE protein n=1 Tax=Mariniflexile gromovii TaxID=362523 RepID=A0ABS4BNM2_9FLAO|nr:BT4734/BF3469 family protein [Mariniflexile gromovii]MBP0902207.1 VirE protein [Mariniflexile gromovii]
MEVSRQAILDRTHYGLNIYAYVLRQYYPETTVLSVKGRDCGITRNPFNGGKETLRIHIDGVIATHRDTELETFQGDVFDFAQYHFKMADETDVLQMINQELHLNLEIKVKDELVWLNGPDDTWYARCSFFKAPVRNVFPVETLRLHQVFELITSDKYKKITDALRAITDIKEARKFKANHFDYVTFSGTFEKRNDSNLLKHSNLLTIDFDHLENLQELKEQLLNDEYFETEMLFTSPSGDGLKWIIRIDILEVSHNEYFKAIANYIKHTYNIEVDQSGKDVSRACFLPYDPTAFLHKRHQAL